MTEETLWGTLFMTLRHPYASGGTQPATRPHQRRHRIARYKTRPSHRIARENKHKTSKTNSNKKLETNSGVWNNIGVRKQENKLYNISKGMPLQTNGAYRLRCNVSLTLPSRSALRRTRIRNSNNRNTKCLKSHNSQPYEIACGQGHAQILLPPRSKCATRSR